MTGNVNYGNSVPNTGLMSFDGSLNPQVIQAANPALAIAGTNGTTSVPQWNNLVAGTGIDLSQSTNQITVSNTNASGGPSGSVAWSPYQWINVPLTNDVVVTAPYVSTTPSLSQMQTILTGSISPKLSNSIIYASLIGCNGVTGANSMGIMYGLFSSANPTDAALYSIRESGAVGSTTPGNFSSGSLVAFHSSTGIGSTLTFTLAATLSPNASAMASPNPTVYSTNTSNPFGGQNPVIMRIWEVVPDSPQTLWVKNMSMVGNTLVTTAYGSGTNSTTVIFDALGYFYKFVTNSLIQIRMTIGMQGNGSSSYFANLRAWTTTDGFSSSGGGIDTIGAGALLLGNDQGGFQKGNTSATLVTGGNTSASLQLVSTNCIGTTPENMYSGPFGIIVGAEYQNQQFYCLTQPYSYIEVSEIVPGTTGGELNTVQITPISATVIAVAPSYPWTSNINVETGTYVGVFSINALNSGSTIYVTGNAYCQANSGNPETGVLLAFYTQVSWPNPIRLLPVSTPSGGSSYNTNNVDFDITFASSGVQSVSVYAWVYDSASPSVNVNIDATYKEIVLGTIGAVGAVESITANGYLTATAPVDGVITMSTQQATTSQPGLLALATTPPANTLPMMPTTGGVFVPTAGRGINFASAIAIYFGGAISTGQVFTTRFGVVMYEDVGVYLPTATTGLSQVVWKVGLSIGVTLTNMGVGTGVATVVGLPVNPVIGMPAYPYYIEAEPLQGISIPNGTKMFAALSNNSQVIGLYYYTFNTLSYTQMTNTNFLAGTVAFRLFVQPLLTNTVPPAPVL